MDRISEPIQVTNRGLRHLCSHAAMIAVVMAVAHSVVGPWKEQLAKWHEDNPEWIRTLGTIAANAQARYSRVGRPRLL
jgi:hypothetical protein